MFLRKREKSMRSQKGVTMIGLIMYITCFLVITGIVAGVTAFFYGNSTLMTEELYSAADFNKLNLYLVKESEQIGNRVDEILLEDDTAGGQDATQDAKYVAFSNGDRLTFDTNAHLLYYNSICLCEDVQKFRISLDYTSGKEVLSVMVGFTNKSYTCKYTMAQ